MSSLAWYWHRVKAMSPAELAAHGRRKVHQFTDSLRGERRFNNLNEISIGGTFPQLTPPERAPAALRAALVQDVEDILAGRWIAFGHLEIQVDDPPRWHKDYLAGIDLTTDKPALKLHHRLEGKADIKLMWEPSRWYSLVRLAQGAYILRDPRATAACLKWLEDWTQKNPPFYGWNWTSALETGIRLIQFCWLDALLTAAGAPTADLARLRTRILPPHLWFTWRDRSFGSSANNHLIGELAGLILAVVRWPDLTRWVAPLDTLQRLWEKEVLTQFAPDGGNREQALNYHLFSWEFCWQARLALRAAGRAIAPQVEDRLRSAVDFFTAVQSPEQQWDYGDSDSAYVTPLFTNWKQATTEWHRWMTSPADSSTLAYWLGDAPKPLTAAAIVKSAGHWLVYPESGYAVCRIAGWFLRWDLSPLGYLATAGHGHCDALHLSAWFQGEAVLIDPGTGTYHADRPVRDYLASWQAHNGPQPVDANFPERRGAFLWSGHHELPRWQQQGELTLSTELPLPTGTAKRSITYLPAENGWRIDDAFYSSDAARQTEVFFQFAPACDLRSGTASHCQLRLSRSAVTVQIGSGWDVVETSLTAPKVNSDTIGPRNGICSPAFRAITTGPFIRLRGLAKDSSRLQTILRPLSGNQ